MKETEQPFIENQNPTGALSEQKYERSSNARIWDVQTTGGHFIDRYSQDDARLETYETDNQRGNSNLF